MPTIRDVAKLAQVAPITVSRVINNSGYVSDSTRHRVEQAIAELNYIPNRLGPSLRSKRTDTIALVVTDITNPFWTTVTRGAEDAAQDEEYHLFLCNSDESPDKQQKYLELMLSRQVDGFLLAPAESTTQAIDMIHQQDVPVVVLDRRVPTKNIDIVRTDSTGGSYRLTQHLLELGHEQIVILSGPENVSTAQDRTAGYQQAMQEAGLPDAVYWGHFHQESGHQQMCAALENHPNLTAVVAANNFIAIGAMRAIAAAGLSVPDDISLVAFDELPEALTLQPFFTAVTQPAYDMGYRAAKLLIQRILNADEPYQELVLPTRFIVRHSAMTLQSK